MSDFCIRPSDDYNVEGGPAFGHGDHMNGGHPGMSLRDYFAGQALPSVIGMIGIPEDAPDDLWDAAIARQAYALADAMLVARKAPSP